MPAKRYVPHPVTLANMLQRGDVAAVTELEMCQGGAPPTPSQPPQTSRSASSKDGDCPNTCGKEGPKCLTFKKKGIETMCLTGGLM